jgi:Universal stress protein family
MVVFSRAGGGHKARQPSGSRAAHERATGQPGQSPERATRQHWLDPAHRRVVVGVDGSPDSAVALVRAASQARQRNATLDVVYVLPDGADARAAILARVMLGEFTRRVCPYGVGTPVCFRVERGNPQAVLLMVSADAELLITGR